MIDLHVRAGDEVLASRWNALVDELDRRGGGAGGAQLGNVIAHLLTALMPQRFQVCLITERVLTGDGKVNPDTGRTAYLRENIRYKGQGVDAPGVRFDESTDVHYGAPTREGEMLIYPAEVGSTCILERYVDEEGTAKSRLYVMTGVEGEALAFRTCTGGSGAG